MATKKSAKKAVAKVKKTAPKRLDPIKQLQHQIEEQQEQLKVLQVERDRLRFEKEQKQLKAKYEGKYFKTTQGFHEQKHNVYIQVLSVEPERTDATNVTTNRFQIMPTRRNGEKLVVINGQREYMSLQATSKYYGNSSLKPITKAEFDKALLRAVDLLGHVKDGIIKKPTNVNKK